MSQSPQAGRPVTEAGRLSLVAQVLLLQVAVVAVSLAVGFGWHISKVDENLRDEYAQRALAIADSVAGDPEVSARMEGLQGTDLDADALRTGILQREAVEVRRRTDILFVVIANRDGIRVAHPEPAEVGRHVSTDPGAVLQGGDVVESDRGTLGDSVRGKAPILDGQGRVIGFVSAGISTASVAEASRADILVTIGFASAALGVGVLGAVLLARRWRRLTLGLQPDELVDLVGEQRAVLHALADGVIAVDQDGRLRVVNDKARQLLSIDAPIGTHRTELGLTERLREFLEEPRPSPSSATVGDRIVVVSSHRVRADGRDLGVVMSVIDRTDIENLTRELDSIKSMSEALRAQRHETANRFHVLAGLLRHGHVDEAVDYLSEVSGARGSGSMLAGLDNVEEPHLHAFLDAKASLARERGVTLSIGSQTWVSGTLIDPVAVTTVVGNLIDNAVDAAAGDPGSASGRVDVELLTDDGTLWVTVVDSGPGISFADPDEVFAEGTSTKDESAAPGGRGMGLVLTRQVCRRTGGDLTLVHPGGRGGELGGAVFVGEVRGAVDDHDAADDDDVRYNQSDDPRSEDIASGAGVAGRRGAVVEVKDDGKPDE